MYMAVASRPDSMSAASILARQVQHTCQRYVALAKHILRYLKGAKEPLSLLASESHNPMVVFCGAEWAVCCNTIKSTTGVTVTANDGRVLWTTKKRNIIALFF